MNQNRSINVTHKLFMKRLKIQYISFYKYLLHSNIFNFFNSNYNYNFSCSEYPIVEFAFRVFDTARQESLSSHEINKLVDAIWGPTAGGNQ